MEYINNPPRPPEMDHSSFEYNDLIVPNMGLRYSFTWDDRYILDDRYIYHKASQEEYHLYYSRIINGFESLGYTTAEDMINSAKMMFVKNYKEL